MLDTLVTESYSPNDYKPPDKPSDPRAVQLYVYREWPKVVYQGKITETEQEVELPNGRVKIRIKREFSVRALTLQSPEHADLLGERGDLTGEWFDSPDKAEAALRAATAAADAPSVPSALPVQELSPAEE